MSRAGRALRRLSPAAADWMWSYRNGAAELLPPRRVFALPPLHEKIKRHFPFKGGVFFEAGANDGLTQSNTAYLERYRDWRGFLVEPLPAQFAQCVSNRPAAKVINAALVSEDAAAEATIGIRYSNLMSVIDDPAHILVTADDHLELGHQFLGNDRELSGRTFTVPTTTVSRILDKAGQQHIDFFSLDVEGYELEVLKGIDFHRHRPHYFLVETRNSDALETFFRARKYRCLGQWSERDVFYADANG